MLIRQFLFEWKIYARDRGAMFWTFLFPVLLLLGFGVIFRSGATPTLTLVVTGPAVSGSDAQAIVAGLASSPVRALVLEPREAEARWHRGDTAAQLDCREDGPRLKVNTYLASQGQLTAQVVQEAFLAAQVDREGRKARFLPVAMESPGHAQTLNYASFLLPGLLGLNLLSVGLFSVGMVNVAYREKGKFRRLGVTPLPKSLFLGAQVLQRLTVAFVQAILMLIVGRIAFGITNQGSYLDLALVMALGSGCFMAMGFALAGFTRTTEGYGALSNLFFFPMMFLSGVYFTLDSAPRWLQQAVVVLPLSPFIRTLRAVFNDGSSLAGHGLGLCIVGAWTAVCFLVAVKKFSWS